MSSRQTGAVTGLVRSGNLQAAPDAMLGARKPGWISLLFSMPGLVIPVVFLLSTCMTSRLYWGYWVTAPASERTASHLSELTSFTSFWYSGPESGRAALARSASRANYISGEAPDGRLPVALIERGLLPTSEQAVDASVLRAFKTALAERGLLRQGNPGYGQATDLQGHIAAGKDHNGRDIYVAALVGGEVSNDHLPYYEMVAAPVGSDRVTITRFRFYWWDRAGLEGFAHWFGGIAGVTVVIVVWFLVSVWLSASRFVRARYPKMGRAA
jgi:hypothetical protein